ncbi:class I SAM-dependent methyltransferase [Williamsia sp. 1135]|uniref:class I SAM-dependent methyltransferase n=1 Tax=Williamsia sp. 1135 TaxID=1889262 RepID=UPI000A10A1E7|nr:class I SAM-dependent methyltransferase [Williamsia sp. 1135]ORM38269.1 SAM-dependent methyltransferase [Williamsia sp. 1135]
MANSTRRSGDFDYEHVGAIYGRHRRADPRIASRIQYQLAQARSVLNVGAGTGSYEPADRTVLAVEPSPAMRAARPRGAVPTIAASAQRLPFDDDSIDAAMAVLTVHQWGDGLAAGLREVRRVTRGPIVIMTLDVDALADFWLTDYFPSRPATEHARFPDIAELATILGGSHSLDPVPIPNDCTDGFVEAFYARPEAYLDPEIRSTQSTWQFITPTDTETGLTALAADLRSGTWDARYGHLRTQPAYTGPLTLLTANP